MTDQKVIQKPSKMRTNSTVDSLPNELLMEIVQKMNFSDIVTLRSIHWRFQAVCEDEYLLGKLRPIPFEVYLNLLTNPQNKGDISFLSKVSVLKLIEIKTMHQLVFLHMKLDNPRILYNSELYYLRSTQNLITLHTSF